MADNGTIAPTDVCVGVNKTHMMMPVFTAILENSEDLLQGVHINSMLLSAMPMFVNSSVFIHVLCLLGMQ